MEDSQNDWDDSPDAQTPQGRVKGKTKDEGPSAKRRCVSSACIACRKRKSKCDGNLPSCAACSSVYHTPCIYDPNSDHRRKGVYKKDIDNLRTRNTTLQTLIHAILNYDDDDVQELVRQIRSCDNLEDVADAIKTQEKGLSLSREDIDQIAEENAHADQFEAELSGRMSELMLDGSMKFIGGTSNLVFLPSEMGSDDTHAFMTNNGLDRSSNFSVSQWTRVTDDERLVGHLMTMYFTWHYAYFTTLSKSLFYRDYIRRRPSQYCSSLLVNAMLALGCHFSSWEGARENPADSATAGDHFFKEAKRLILEHDEHERAKLCTVQALALMSVREAGCGREGKGWVYSGMSFRMAYDLGLNVAAPTQGPNKMTEEEIDARRITIWGCFLFDKCWSNYLGRQPQIASSNISVPKFEIFPAEEAEQWSPYTDTGVGQEHSQPARTRAVAFQISKLCEISNDLLAFFYHPAPRDKQPSRQSELKRLSDVHTRLEAWRKSLPIEMEAKEGQLPQVLLMHMFYQLLFIHLYRPFLKYTKSTSPLPQHVSPRRLCTQAGSAISKLLRIYKRTYGLRQICNIAVYIAHSACTIHILNLPDKNAKRDLVHGLRNLEEIAEGWLCARRTIRILDLSANKWHVELPPEAVAVFERTHTKWGSWGSWDNVTSPSVTSEESPQTNQTSTSVNHSTPELSTSIQAHDRTIPATTTTPFQTSESTYPTQATRFPRIPDVYTMANAPAQQPYGSFRHQRSSRNLQSEPNYLRPTPRGAFGSSSNLGPSQPDVSSNNSTSSDSPAAATSTPPMPVLNTMIMDNSHLAEENPDWWTQDQSALALGLENWGEGWGISGPGTDGNTGYDDLITYETGFSTNPPSTSSVGQHHQPNQGQQYSQLQRQPLTHSGNIPRTVNSTVPTHSGAMAMISTTSGASNNQRIASGTSSTEADQDGYGYMEYPGAL